MVYSVSIVRICVKFHFLGCCTECPIQSYTWLHATYAFGYIARFTLVASRAWLPVRTKFFTITGLNFAVGVIETHGTDCKSFKAWAVIYCWRLSLAQYKEFTPESWNTQISCDLGRTICCYLGYWECSLPIRTSSWLEDSWRFPRFSVKTCFGVSSQGRLTLGWWRRGVWGWADCWHAHSERRQVIFS